MQFSGGVTVLQYSETLIKKLMRTTEVYQVIRQPDNNSKNSREKCPPFVFCGASVTNCIYLKIHCNSGRRVQQILPLSVTASDIRESFRDLGGPGFRGKKRPKKTESNLHL